VSRVPAPPEGLRTTSDPEEGSTRIVLIRHGQGICNVDGRIGGPVGCTGLTSLGRAQAAALGERLARSGELGAATVLYASTLPRAIETMVIVAKALDRSPAEIVEERALSELEPGEADGLIWEDYAQRYGAADWDRDPSVPLSPGAESWNRFVDRSGAALEDLAAAHEGALVVVGTHAGFIEATVLRHLVGSPEGADHPRLRLRTEHASMTEWERSSTGWRLLRYNDAFTAPR
jgi:probable phosphoglycerate mutase